MISLSALAGAPEPAGPLQPRSLVDTPVTARDFELVRRFNSGDESAFVEIVGWYRDKMLAAALSVIRNHGDAEEIAQDTFIRAHRALAHFRGEASLATWLRSIAINLARNRYWHFHRRHRQDSISLECPPRRESRETFADLIASGAPDPARLAATAEFAASVRECIKKLSAPQREILTLRNLLDRSYGEIAETLGLSMGTVKSRVARARECLRELLMEIYAGHAAGASEPVRWFESNRPLGGLTRATSASAD